MPSRHRPVGRGDAMSKRPFVLPTGVEMELADDRLSIRYDGDVVVEHTFGRTIGEIVAGGDLTVSLERITGTLTAGGTLTLVGDIDATQLHARMIVLGDQKVKCRAITASERITIGAAKLTV